MRQRLEPNLFLKIFGIKATHWDLHFLLKWFRKAQSLTGANLRTRKKKLSRVKCTRSKSALKNHPDARPAIIRPKSPLQWLNGAGPETQHGRRSMPETSAARTAIYRQRLTGELPPVEWFTCATDGCTRLHRGTYGKVCSVCWRKTQEGRLYLAEMTQMRRQRAALAKLIEKRRAK